MPWPRLPIATGRIGRQRSASFLAWTFDAFDFFLMVFALRAIAVEFGTPITEVTVAIVLTLATRPIGAYIFGRAADRWGRRPTLVVVIVLYSIFELLSAFSPNLAFLLAVRALFGISMGVVWGVGSSLTMETIPSHSRGLVSGLLQAGVARWRNTRGISILLHGAHLAMWLKRIDLVDQEEVLRVLLRRVARDQRLLLRLRRRGQDG